jgi:nitronate monooxygenase
MANQVGSKSWKENRLTSRLGLQYPIIQGPLGGLSSQRLTAAVSNYGGLGSFGAHGLKPEAIRKVIREIKVLTPKPFAMNLWVSMEDEGALTSTEEAFHRSISPLEKHIESVGGGKPSYRPYEPIRFEDQVQVLLEEGISAFSFIYGIPSKEILDEFRRKRVVLIGTATTVDEAIALDQADVDVIAASGFEAGGHRGSFLQSSEDSLTGTMALVPQVVDAVSVPVPSCSDRGGEPQTLSLILGRLGGCRIFLTDRPLYSEQVEEGGGHHGRNQCHDDEHCEEGGREYVSVVSNVQHDQLNQASCIE